MARNRLPPTPDEQVVHIPNLVRDEEGAVMVEMLIVLPFLMTVILGMFFYMDVNRFLSATQQMAAMQTWEGVARNASAESGAADFEEDDNFGIGGLPIPGGLGDLLGAATVKLAMTGAAIAGGDIRAGLIYSIGGLSNPIAPPYVIQGMPNQTFDNREFEPASLGGPAQARYANETYTTPFMGVLNSYIGHSAQQGTHVNRTEIFVGTRHSAINDPFSVYYGIGEQRLRNVDRFTLMRDPIYLAAAVTQTFISGNVVIPTGLAPVLKDTGLDEIPGLGAIANAISLGGALDGIGALLEQAEPLRKVDKRMDKDHDVDGDADWGEEEIPDARKLQVVGNQNKRKEMAY
jgi:hypothetical protein